jgi:hypothetical protein
MSAPIGRPVSGLRGAQRGPEASTLLKRRQGLGSRQRAQGFKTEPGVTGSGFGNRTRCRWHTQIFKAVGFYESKSKEEVEKHMASKSAFTKFVALTRSRGWAALCLALWLLGLGLCANAQEGTFVTFDAPGAGTEPSLGTGTFPFAINPAGAITGTSCSALFVCQGFLRAPDGTFTTFGATATSPSSINPAGAITGTGSAGGLGFRAGSRRHRDDVRSARARVVFWL